jgi:hypothetical protein
MKRLAVLAVAAAALLVPSTALAGGVVLKVQRAAHLVAVAESPAKVALVRTGAAARLRVGERVMFSAGAPRVVGHVHHVRFRGFLLRSTPSHLVVSAAGAPVTLVRHDDRGTQPTPGTTVEVSATVGQGELEDDDVTQVSATQPGGALEGTLTIGTGTVTVVSEHIALVLNVPSGFDLSAFRNGDEVIAAFAQQPDGTLTLTSLTARDQEEQGDDDGGHDGGGDHGGDGGGGGGDG